MTAANSSSIELILASLVHSVVCSKSEFNDSFNELIVRHAIVLFMEFKLDHSITLNPNDDIDSYKLKLHVLISGVRC